jgi:hypothetical protein
MKLTSPEILHNREYESKQFGDSERRRHHQFVWRRIVFEKSVGLRMVLRGSASYDNMAGGCTTTDSENAATDAPFSDAAARSR